MNERNRLYQEANVAGVGEQQGMAYYAPLVTLSTRGRGQLVEVRVKDNGFGIPAAIKDKIFQPFFTTKPTGQGTGLELSMAYDIVTKGHGGELRVESEEGAFTEFILLLPQRAMIKEGAAPVLPHAE